MNNFRFLDAGKTRGRYSFNFNAEGSKEVFFSDILLAAKADGLSSIRLKRLEFELLKEEGAAFEMQEIPVVVNMRAAAVQYSNAAGPDGVYKGPENDLFANGIKTDLSSIFRTNIVTATAMPGGMTLRVNVFVDGVRQIKQAA